MMIRPPPVLLLAALAVGTGTASNMNLFMTPTQFFATKRLVTRGPGERILTNTGIGSPDGEWIVYDRRNDAAGDLFDGACIEMVNVSNGEARALYEAKNGAHWGVATFHPREWKGVFILGPENPTPDWQYSACHRQGIIVDVVRQASSLSGRACLRLTRRRVRSSARTSPPAPNLRSRF
jgi:hypothetical protein